MSFFEIPNQICYCVPNGASACAPCRERRAAEAVPLSSPPVRPPLVLNRLPPLAISLPSDADLANLVATKRQAYFYDNNGNRHILNLREYEPCLVCQNRLKINNHITRRLICTQCKVEIDYEDA